MSGDYAVEVDDDEDRLYLTLSGMLDAETAHTAADAVVEAAGEVGQNFQMITDISEFRPMSQDATDAIEKGKEGLAEAGLSAVVRVVGDSVTGKMQFDRVGGDVEGYHVATAENREQAEELLDEFRD